MINKTKNLFKKLRHIKAINIFVVLFVLILSIFIAGYTSAGTGTKVGAVIATIIGWVLFAIAWSLGQLLVLMMEILVWIAQWSTFISAPAVGFGWKIVRDICNMFFVVIMLVIAFATVLRVEKYSYEKLLPKLIIMAVLINFSKMICGLIIDVSQVVMLTFVNSFKDVAGSNLTNMMGLNSLMSMSGNAANTETAEVTGWTVLGSYVLAIIYIIISLITIVTMVLMLTIRIIMIWIYVVLSPMAYLLGAFPDGQKYASKWWTEFSQNVIVGPVLAFFIWLSFASLGGVTDQASIGGVTAAAPTVAETTGDVGASTEALTVAGSPNHMLNFVISIAMLYGGLQVSQSIGGAAAGMAGKGISAINQGKGYAVKGLKWAAGGLAYSAIANKYTGKHVKNALASTAATSGLKGRFLAAAGIRGLATSGLIAYNKREKKLSEKAQAKIESLKDTRVVSRFAKEGAWTPSGTADQKKAVNMMPSALADGTAAGLKKMNEKLASMSVEDLRKLSDAEWHALGKAGAVLGGKAENFIAKDTDARGALNLGRVASGMPLGNIGLAQGTDKNGLAIAGPARYGSYYNRVHGAGLPPMSPDEIATLERTGSHSTQYLRENEKTPVLEPEKVTTVLDDDKNSPRGNGNLAINEVARGSSSTIAVDFDKLNLSEIDKGKDANWQNTRGLNTSDQQMIGKVASKMLEVINQEKAGLMSKAIRNPGEQKRLASLEKAEAYFKEPTKIKNLSLLNSSAAKYKTSDVKEVKIHEEMHGLGYNNEKDVTGAAKTIVETRNYSARADRGKIDQIIKNNNKGISDSKQDLGESSEKISNTVQEKEKASEIEFNNEAKSSSADMDLGELNKTLEKFSEKMDNVARKFNSASGKVGSSSSAPKAGGDNSYLFKNLSKNILSSNSALIKKVSMLGGEKAETPLEVDVIYNESLKD